jgi:hypothetical protein
MMIVEGNAPLARAYALNIIAIYQTYRWNTYVDAHAKDSQAWRGLVDNAAWQDSYLKNDGADLAEIKFWLGKGVSAQTAAGQPAAGPAQEKQERVPTGPSPQAGATARRRQSAAKTRSRAKIAPAKPRRTPTRKAAANGATQKNPVAKKMPSKKRAAGRKASGRRSDATKTRRPVAKAVRRPR